MTKHKHRIHPHTARKNTNGRSVQASVARTLPNARTPRDSRLNGASRNGKSLLSEGASELKGALDSGLESAKSLVHEGERAASSVAQSASSVAQSANSVAQSMLDSIKRNPIPAALAGLGVACTGVGMTWLMMQQGRSALQTASSHANANTSPSKPALGALANGFAASAQTSIKRVASDAGQLARRAQSSVSDVAHTTGETLERLASDAKSRALRIESASEDMFRTHPLGVGAAALAVGVAIGMALPSTVREGQWLGKSRDQVVDKAEALARDVASRVGSLAKPLAEAVRQA